MKLLFIFLLLLSVIIKSTIIDNCLKYFDTSDTTKNICLECREGYYSKSGHCVQCNKLIQNLECFSRIKLFTYASNIENSTRIDKNSTQGKNISNQTNKKQEDFNKTQGSSLLNNNQTTAKNCTIKHENNTNTNSSQVEKQQKSEVVRIDNNCTKQLKAANEKTNPQQNVAVDMKNPQSVANNSQLNQSSKQKEKSQPATLFSTVSFENCKQVNPTGKCVKCFIGYESDDIGHCRKIKKKDVDKSENCEVYSDVASMCMICDDGYNVDDSGACKLGTTKQSHDQVQNQKKILTSIANLTKNSSFSSPNGSTTIELDRNGSNDTVIKVGSASPAKIEPSKQISTDSITPASLNIPLKSKTAADASGSLSFTLPSVSLDKSKTKEAKQASAQVALIKSADSGKYILKDISPISQNCAEFENSDRTSGVRICKKCKDNYLLNILINQCVPVSKSIDFSTQAPPSNTLTTIAAANTSTLASADNKNSNITNVNSNTSNSTNSSSAAVKEPIPSGNDTATTVQSGQTTCPKIAKCEKLKDPNNSCSECAQCQATTQLYNNKCWDTFSYRLMIAAKAILAKQAATAQPK